MGNRIKIVGVPPYDGEYDVEDIDYGELRRIKEVTGLSGAKLLEAYRNGDPDIDIGLAVVGLERAGIAVNLEVLWRAKPGAFEEIEDEDDAEVDADPPALAPLDGDETNSSNSDSGSDTTRSSERSENGQSATGVPSLAGPADSDLAISPV